jgi:DNA-binding CsgD family transcriptional regulator
MGAEQATERVHTLRVARRVTSRQLVGRTGQLAALRGVTASAAQGEPRIALISGDAGIGKTRLITEIVATGRADGFITATGGCLQLGEVSVAYAPLIEALRDLRAQLGDADLDELLGPVLSSLPGTNGSAAAQSSGPFFEQVLGFLIRLSQRQPVLITFEDLHWADASTRDLVAFLSRNLRNAAVALLLTYRGDELHRRHPLRPLIADLERGPLVERVALTGLDRAELVSLLNEICDDAPTDETAIDDLLARSDGNPLYIEELVAAGGVSGPLPSTLADVILARVSRLPEAAQDVLHQAAVLGQDVDDNLLATVTRQPIETVTAAMRAAVFDQLLVIDGDACRFRHALVREALYDDLLPGERERLHVAAAQALPEATRLSEQARWAMIAYHWDSAHDAPKAYAASVRAAVEAENVHAFADAAEQFERALQLYDQVPPAEQGMTRATLLLRAADAVQAGSRTPRAIVLAEGALRALGEDATPEQRALVLERLGRINWTMRHGPAAVAAYEQAVALLEGRPPSREQAFALSALGQSLMQRDQYGQADAVLRHAIEVARSVDARDVQGHALCSLGPVLVALGRVDESYETMVEAREMSRRHGTADDVSRAYVNLVHCLYFGGEYDRAAREGAEGIDYAARTGYLRHYGEAIAGNSIAALLCAGRWHDADVVRADPRVPDGDPYQELRWLPLLLGQGRYDEARGVSARCLLATADADDVQFRALALMRAAELAAHDERWDEARAMLAEVLARAQSTDDQYYTAQAYALAVRVEADRVAATVPGADDTARAVADELRGNAREFAAAKAAKGTALLPEPAAWLVTAEAEHARAWGRDDADGWAEVAATWDQLGQPYPAALARCYQADALLRSRGSRDDAAAAARRALRVAVDLGAEPLATAVRELARRSRLDLADEAGARGRDPIAELNVTRRELDVLRLLAEGRTNRQIGASLFISEKTASVHVTNLLRKLGVPNRIAAAAIAQRVGLSEPP